MIHGKRITRQKPDSLALLSLFVALAAVVTTAVGNPAGSDSIDFKDLTAEVQSVQRRVPVDK